MVVGVESNVPFSEIDKVRGQVRDLQKCIAVVFVVDNVRSRVDVHIDSLLTVFCSFCSSLCG